MRLEALLPRRWVIFVLTTGLFVLSQFYRATPAVIAPWLMAELAIDPRGMSLLSAAFFYAFALTQVPLGLVLDRVGPRRTMTVLSLLAVAGALLFAGAASVSTLTAARLLLGVGMACNLMGTLKLITLWFPAQRFATLSALVFSIGTVGNLAAATPLVLLVQAVGWRRSFWVFAAVNFLLAVAVWCVVRDRPDSGGQTPTTGTVGKPLLDWIRQLVSSREYWIISLATFCRYGVYAAVQTLWAGPFLINALGLSSLMTGNLILLMNLGFVAGGPFFGALSDQVFRSRKWVVVAGLFGLALLLSGLAFLRPGGTLLPALLLLAFGVVSSTGGIMYPHIRECLPLEMAGTAMTGINLFTMLGAAVFLQGMGGLMARLYPAASLSPEAFRAAFLMGAACLAAVGVVYLFCRDTTPGGRVSE